MFIRSERLFLRPGWPEDWEELLARLDDEAVVRNLALTPWPYTADDARTFAAKPQEARFPHFFVTLPTGTAAAEIVGAAWLRQSIGETELGCWIARGHWGQGYATEAIRAVLPLARTLGHHRVTAGQFLDNPASGRVLRKAGFRPTGEVRQRLSHARGTRASAMMHAIAFDEPGCCPSGCNDSERGSMAQRAA